MRTAMTQPRPSILLCVTGMTPQVVTETLYALSREHPPILPTEVHILSTRPGVDHALRTLLSEKPGWYHRLCRDHGLPAGALSAERVHVLQDADGELDDLRSRDDNRRAADIIGAWVRRLTQDPATDLHLSLAGGRKTMSHFAAFALSLYGRPGDRLSHVLVSEPFENHPKFYYPTPHEAIIYPRRGDKTYSADCRDAVIDLADIPFVRLREQLPEAMTAEDTAFSELIARVNRAHQPPRLRLDPAHQAITADDITIELGHGAFALYHWLASRAIEEADPVSWRDPAQVAEFLHHARALLGEFDAPLQRLEEALAWRNDDRDYSDYFSPLISKHIRKPLAKALGPEAAERYQIARSGHRNAYRYQLPLAPEAIENDVRTSQEEPA